MVHNQNDHVRNHLIEKMMPQVTPHKFLEVVFYVELKAQEEPESKIVLKILADHHPSHQSLK